MANDPNNASVWANADVYIGAITAPIPASGAAFSAAWDTVGLLNGDDGFSESIDMDSTDFYAWGGILVATSRKNFKLSRTFTAFEDNETMYDLWYPGHDVTFAASGNGYEGDINVPDLQAKFRIAFQTISGTTIKRVVSSSYAQLDGRGDAKEGESDLSSRAATVIIYPDATGKLFHTFKGAAA